jgi:hypothetical protein
MENKFSSNTVYMVLCTMALAVERIKRMKKKKKTQENLLSVMKIYYDQY